MTTACPRTAISARTSRKLDDAEIAANRSGTSNDPKADAAVRFAVAVTRSRGHTPKPTSRRSAIAGYTDAQVIEIVQHVALNTWTNYFNEVFKTDIDFPSSRPARRPEPGLAVKGGEHVSFQRHCLHSRVKAVQAARGSRAAYARVEARGGFRTEIDDALQSFLAGADSAYLATANAAGQPYVQHRGGPRGFIRVVGERTLGFADYSGNRQYISTGNLSENPQAFLFLMDYAHRHRVKIWGRARIVEGDEALIAALMPEGYAARAEQVILFDIDAWDTNCPKHIPQKFDAADVAAAIATAREPCRRTRSRERAPERTYPMSRPPLPPFTDATAAEKARLAEDAWNSRDPARVALAYTPDSQWRNRAEFITGRAAIEAFLAPQMGARARLPTDQGGLGPCRQPHRGALRVRVSRRQRVVVPRLWQRELAVRRRRIDGAAGSPASTNTRSGRTRQVSLAARPPARRSPGTQRIRLLTRVPDRRC